MSFTISLRSVVFFLAGVVTAVIVVWVFQGMRADAGGDESASFVPIEPCRIVDTRPTRGIGDRTTPLGPGEVLTVQGTGPSGNCDVAADAVGLVLNVTADQATENTNLRLYPTGADVPTTSNLNPRPGAAPTPNAVVVGLDGSGRFDIRNAKGEVHVIIDVAGYYTNDLAERVAALESAVSALEAKTADMSVTTVDGYPVVRFSGVNVQVVSGSGTTGGVVNGTGNLIVGYNSNSSDTRTGSHNLIVGDLHSYSSHGGLVAGWNNTLSGVGASVTGGVANTASGERSSVTGGAANTASGRWSSVSGGGNNQASGEKSSASGGESNLASGTLSSVSGGDDNAATNSHSSVSGGGSNLASGTRSSVTGGFDNIAEGAWSSVSGGQKRGVSGTDDWRAGELFQGN